MKPPNHKSYRTKKTIGKLKKDLWKIFSIYIRMRDADEHGFVSCCTCGKRKHWREVDAGHFIPKSRGNSIYFVEDNVHGQCKGCNMSEGGAFERYYPFMVEKYGQNRVDELTELSRAEKKFKSWEYEEMITKYKQAVENLKAGRDAWE